MMRLYIEIIFILCLLDKVVDEFCGMEDLNRYHIQHHHRDLRIIVGMATTMMVLLVADMIW